ncbi:hypothetical protein WN943_005708 [Citrus x changshan-huyou]
MDFWLPMILCVRSDFAWSLSVFAVGPLRLPDTYSLIARELGWFGIIFSHFQVLPYFILWQVWKAYNAFRFDSQRFSVNTIIHWVGLDLGLTDFAFGFNPSQLQGVLDSHRAELQGVLDSHRAELGYSKLEVESDFATTESPAGLFGILYLDAQAVPYYNTTYMIQNHLETYFSVANNNNYQGHTTCKATISQNSVDYRNLTLGLDLLVSLMVCLSYFRSAASGFNHLLTYMVSWGDGISAIAFLFNVDQHALLDANKLSQDDLTFPFTPILVLFKLPPPRSSYLYHLHHLLLHTPPSYSYNNCISTSAVIFPGSDPSHLFCCSYSLAPAMPIWECS